MVRYEPPLGVGGCPARFFRIRSFGDFLKIIRNNRKNNIFRAAGAKIKIFVLFRSSFLFEHVYFSAPAAGKKYPWTRIQIITFLNPHSFTAEPSVCKTDVHHEGVTCTAVTHDHCHGLAREGFHQQLWICGIPILVFWCALSIYFGSFCLSRRVSATNL